MSDEIEWREVNADQYYNDRTGERRLTVSGGAVTKYEIAVPPLTVPTEPGFYEDRDGDVWYLSVYNEWQLSTKKGEFEEANYVTDSGVGDYLPLTPLRLVSEEWAKEHEDRDNADEVGF